MYKYFGKNIRLGKVYVGMLFLGEWGELFYLARNPLGSKLPDCDGAIFRNLPPD